MPRKYGDGLREAAAQAIMRRRGFELDGSIIAAAQRNPRAAEWLADADAVIAVVYPRLTQS